MRLYNLALLVYFFKLFLFLLNMLLILLFPFIQRFQQRLHREATVTFLTHAIENEQQSAHYNYHKHNTDDHYIELPRRLIELESASL